MTERRRIRFYNIVEPVNTFFRDLAPYLADHGYEVTILISDAIYREGRSPLHDAFDHPHIHVDYVRVGEAYKTSTARKLLVYVQYILVTMWRTLFGRGTDINFFLTQPPLFSLWGWVLKIVRGQKFATLIMDLYPDVMVQDGLMTDNSVPARVLKWISRVALRNSDHVYVIGRHMGTRLIADGIDADKIIVIPNWMNEDIVRPVAHADNPLRAEHDLHDQFVVLYSGNMGTAHTFDDILTAAEDLQDLDDLTFVFIGKGNRKREIADAIAARGLDNVLMLPLLPLEDLHLGQSLGDVHFVCLREGFEGIVVPSKTYGAFLAGRPVIYQGVAAGEIAQLITEKSLGIAVPPDNAEALKAAILRLYHDRESARMMGERARQAAQTDLSREAALANYAHSLDQLR